jgi:hypothetical protein
LPVPPGAERLSVESQLADPDSTLQFVRRLLELRAREPALQGAPQRSIDAGPGVFCYLREPDLLVALNFTSERAMLDPSEAATLLSTDPARELGEVDPGALLLGPDEGIILRLSRPDRAAGAAPGEPAPPGRP